MALNIEDKSKISIFSTYNIRKALGVFLPAFILFFIGGIHDISYPGIYFDAVNPDYIITLLLNPNPQKITVWTLPGSLLFGIFPVIGQIYHGCLTYYAGLPFYALFGTGVSGIRLTNIMFGLMVISGAGTFLWAFGARTLICSLSLALLALDPGFLFAFRTQFYITLLPVAALLASAALVKRHSRTPSRKIALIAGFLAGVACYGYFIYAFLVPAIPIFAFLAWRRQLTKALAFAWVGGFALGVSPYIVGYFLIMTATGGPRAFLHFIFNNLHSLDVQSSSLSLGERLSYFYYLLHGTIIDVGPAAMMFNQPVALLIPTLKVLLLLGAPLMAIALAFNRLGRVSGLLVVGGIVIGFLALVLTFGNRLWFHHAIFILPVLYVAMGLALERFAGMLPSLSTPRVSLVIAFILAPFLVSNAADRQAVFYQLEKTGGVGLSSDAIARFAEDSLKTAIPPHMFFPDWGVFASFAMITRATIPYSAEFTPDAARAVLCSGQDAGVATSASEPRARLDDWITKVGWGNPKVVSYDRRDGTPVLLVVRWQKEDRPQGACQ